MSTSPRDQLPVPEGHTYTCIRKNLGQDISGACGQLVVGKKKVKKAAKRK